MPTWGTVFVNDSERIEAWKAIYIAKGCHPVKADRVAREKCKRSKTWPPATTSDGF